MFPLALKAYYAMSAIPTSPPYLHFHTSNKSNLTVAFLQNSREKYICEGFVVEDWRTGLKSGRKRSCDSCKNSIV